MDNLQVEKHQAIVVWNSFEWFIEFSRLLEFFSNFGHQSVHKARRGTLKRVECPKLEDFDIEFLGLNKVALTWAFVLEEVQLTQENRARRGKR